MSSGTKDFHKELEIEGIMKSIYLYLSFATEQFLMVLGCVFIYYMICLPLTYTHFVVNKSELH